MVTRVVNRHRRISPRRFNFISDRACNNDFATRSRHHGSQNIYRKTTMPILECLKRRLQDDFAQSINKARSRGKIKRNEARPRGKFPDPLSSNLNDNEGGRGEGGRGVEKITRVYYNPSQPEFSDRSLSRRFYLRRRTASTPSILYQRRKASIIVTIVVLRLDIDRGYIHRV